MRVKAVRYAESCPRGSSSNALELKDSRASASAPTAAADGRKVLSGDQRGTCSGQDGFSGAQDQNMTVLGAAGAPSSRKKILLRSL